MEFLVNLDVDDLERAVDFYQSVFDLREGRRLGSFAVEMLGGPTPIYLLLKDAGSAATPGRGPAAQLRAALGRRSTWISSSPTSKPPRPRPSPMARAWNSRLPRRLDTN